MKVGDLVTFKNFYGWSALTQWRGVIRRACYTEGNKAFNMAHVEVYWINGTLSGQIKCYSPNELIILEEAYEERNDDWKSGRTF